MGFIDTVQVLADCLHEYALNGQPFDVGPYLRRCALDIICGLHKF